jgi:FAD dependent oxidoreductase TIGR03364
MTVVVVGSGVLGLMHAFQARELGHDVIHLEREAGTRGASVRNFGLVWVSGRAQGAELQLALRSRDLWEKTAAEVPGVGFRPHGSLTIARTPAELAVMQAAAAEPDAAERETSVLTPAEARDVNPAVRGGLAGALWCRRDAIVEPRLVPGALREHLLRAGGYQWLPAHEAVEYANHGVRDQHGTWHRGDRVILCTGANYRGLAGEHLGSAPLRRVRLQMMQTAPYEGQLTTSIADGDSLRYYPAYNLPSRSALGPQQDEAAEWHSQLLMVQRLDGSLTIGDTHAYDEPFDFDVQEAPYDHLRAVAASILGTALPRTLRRWAGVYSQVTDDSLYHRAELADGVEVVTGPGGRGMTCAPAIAEETFR